MGYGGDFKLLVLIYRNDGLSGYGVEVNGQQGSQRGSEIFIEEGMVNCSRVWSLLEIS